MSSDYIYIFCIPGSNPRVDGGNTGSSVFNARRGNAVNGSTQPMNNTTVARRSPNLNVQCHPDCSLLTALNVPSDWAPLPARRRNSCTAYIDNPMASIVAVNACAPSSLNVTGDPCMELHDSIHTHCRSAEYFVPEAHSTPVSQENRRADVNGNEAEAVSSTCCCLMFSRQDSSASDHRSRVGVSGSLAFAKDCWQRLCDWSCCIHCLSLVTFKSFRCLLILFASLGLGCIISGIVLGILRMVIYGSFFVLSIMFVGLGVLMIAVVVIGWRCTPMGLEPCRRLFDRCMVRSNSGENQPEGSDRQHRTFDRNQWFGGVIYPEFRSRTPPPPYSSSMHEVANVTVLPPTTVGSHIEADMVPNTPPPAYRLLANVMQCSDSAPPSYCSHSRCTEAGSDSMLAGVEAHEMCTNRASASFAGPGCDTTEVLRSSSAAKYGQTSAHPRLAVVSKRGKSNCARFVSSAAVVDDQVAGPSSAISIHSSMCSDVFIPVPETAFSLTPSMQLGRVPVSIRSRGSAVDECSTIKLDSVI